MMNWQKLIRDLPRDSGDNGSNGENSNGGQGVNSGQQEQGPGIGLNDSFGMAPGEQGPSMGAMNDLSNANSVSAALGDTSIGGFGLSGVMGGVAAPDVSTGLSPTVSNDLSPTSTVNDVTSSFSNTPDKAPGFDAQNAANALSKDAEFSDIGNLGAQAASSSLGKSGAAQSQANANEVTAQEIADASDKDKAKAEMQAVSEDKASREAKEMADKASKEAIDRALAGLVEAPAAIGVNPSTTPTSSPSATPSSTIGSTTGKSTEVSPTSSSTTPTANSSTTKGPTLDITGINLVDSFLSSFVNNPTAAITGLAVGAVNPVAGLVNTAIGNPIGFAADRALSSITGKEPGYGQTSTSSIEPGTSTPSGPGPSTSDQGPSGSDSGGGGGITTLAPTTTTPAATKTTPASTFVDYDLTKSPTAAPKYTYPDYGVYTAPKVTAPQGASFSDNYALQFPVIPKYPNLSNTNQGILDAFPV